MMAAAPIGTPAALLEGLLEGMDDAPALVFGDVRVSRRDLRAAGAAGAAELTRRGIRRGDVIAVWLPNGLAWLQVLFAAARLGVLVVPISPRYKAPEARHLLTVSRARLALAPRMFLDTPYAELAEGLRVDLPHLEAVWAIDDPGALLPVPAADAPVQADGGELLCCFSTSGTTGAPKLAAHNQASIVCHARHVARAMNVRPGDAMLCALPLFGVFGFMGALATLAGGGACVIMQHFEPEPAARLMGPQRITHMLGSDSMFDPMMRVAGADFSAWRHAGFADFVGLSEEVTRRADQLGVRFSATYGSSECYSLMSFNDWEAAPEVRARAGGVPVDPAIEVRIVDPENGAVLPDGERGEIQVRGPNVLDEYLNNPEATAKAKSADGWFRTGDLGYREGEAYVYLARMGDSLRLRGFLVNPAEIENCLIQVKGVGGAQVVGVARPGEGDAAVAYVIAAPDAPLPDEAALVAHCRANIASYKVPVRVVALEAFPTLSGPNGFKVQKRTLRAMARELLGLPPTTKA